MAKWIRFLPILADDYLETSAKIKEFSHISSRAIQPVDIVVTKIGRLYDRDIQDIGDCIRKSRVSEAEIRSRAALVITTYVGREEDYLYNLEFVIERFSKNNNHNKNNKCDTFRNYTFGYNTS